MNAKRRDTRTDYSKADELLAMVAFVDVAWHDDDDTENTLQRWADQEDREYIAISGHAIA